MANSSYVHFGGYFQDTGFKVLFVSASTVLNFIDLVLAFGIIWFERYGINQKRTLTNKLVSLICWNFSMFISLVIVTDIMNYFFGPLNHHFCFVFNLARNFTKSQVMFLLNSIMIARYLFIFWLKNPTSLDDIFWSNFLGVLGTILNLTFNLAAMMVPQKHSIFYYACADSDPRPHYLLRKLIYHTLKRKNYRKQ